MTPAEMVAEFHAKLCDPATQTADLRNALIREEVDELTAATDAGDRVGMADALADCVFVLYGTAHVFGIDLDVVLAEVFRSNMSKELGPNGKAVKGPEFSPADVAGVLTVRPPIVGSWWEVVGAVIPTVGQVRGSRTGGDGAPLFELDVYQRGGYCSIRTDVRPDLLRSAWAPVETVPDWVEVAW